MSAKRKLSRFQTELTIEGEALTVIVEPDARLRKTGRWALRGRTLTLRVPADMRRDEIDKMLAGIQKRIIRNRNRAQRSTDSDLMARASEINQRYFGGELSWRSIRWVSNMEHRYGSFTTGGPTDGDVRISDRMRDFPAYVVDYVIAHELCHRKFPNHSPEFWDYLGRYPYTERARGFLEGLSYAEGGDPDAPPD